MTATKNKFQFVETVEENLGFLRPRQQERAKKGKRIVPHTKHTIIR